MLKRRSRDNREQWKKSFQLNYLANDNHPGTRDRLYEREKDIALAAHEMAELDSINHALNQIRNNQYGVCETCGEAIDLDRLKVRPESTHCLEHAQKQRYFDEEMEYSMSSLEMDDTDSWQTLEEYGTSESPSDFRSDHSDYNQLTTKSEEDERMDQYSEQDIIK